jgi:hypothetical protein
MGGEGIAQCLAELLELGFEYRLQQLYQQFEAGEMSLGYVAKELGLGVRDLYAALERRGLPTANIGANPSVPDQAQEDSGSYCVRHISYLLQTGNRFAPVCTRRSGPGVVTR